MGEEAYMKNIVHLCDCMEFMKGIPDKFYELAIVDPPYFKEYGKKNYTGSDISTTGIRRQTKEIKFWGIPDSNYFEELYRISKNQIIWGCNYYAKYIPDVGRIVWDKKNDASTFSKAEIASKSFSLGVDMFRYEWNGMLQGDMKNKETRIHPTQKPVALYKWLLKNYAEPNDKIFDSHVGSGSIRIACHDMGFDFEGCEIDKDYWQAQEERYNTHIQQSDLFSPEVMQESIYQGALL